MRIWRDESGFTLAELLAAFAILGLVLAAILMIQQASFSAIQAGTNKIEMQQNARAGLERMAREIRETTVALTIAAAGTITFTHPDDGVVTYTLAGTDLTRNGAIYVSGVQALALTYFDANNNVVAAPGNIRRVDITIQTRSEDPSVQVGSPVDTSAVISTTVRLRNL